MTIVIPSHQFETALRKYRSILIYIKGSPDPDAIASSYAVKLLCDFYGIRSVIFSLNNISLQENKIFLSELHIPIQFEKLDQKITSFESYAVVDHQSAYIDGITGIIPCVIHIDHHELIEEKVQVDFRFISQDVGATSTLLGLLIRELKPDIPHDVLSLLSTALLFGIQSDTNQFTHANETDYDALQYLTHYSSGEIINKITHTPLSKITIGLLWEAIENQVLYRDWLIAGIGFVNELQRDSIAVIADFLLNREDVSTVVVFAIIEKNNREGLTLDVSIRSVDGTLNLNELIKKITQQGGARKFKGAYQISLDYFIHAPDREVLWKLVQRTTIEVIKKRRDSLTIPAFKGFYNKFKNWLGNFWE